MGGLAMRNIDLVVNEELLGKHQYLKLCLGIARGWDGYGSGWQ